MGDLTKAQREVLKALCFGSLPTSTDTAYGCVNGPSAKALEKRGLVTLRGDGLGSYKATITDAGREALAADGKDGR